MSLITRLRSNAITKRLKSHKTLVSRTSIHLPAFPRVGSSFTRNGWKTKLTLNCKFTTTQKRTRLTLNRQSGTTKRTNSLCGKSTTIKNQKELSKFSKLTITLLTARLSADKWRFGKSMWCFLWRRNIRWGAIWKLSRFTPGAWNRENWELLQFSLTLSNNKSPFRLRWSKTKSKPMSFHSSLQLVLERSCSFLYWAGNFWKMFQKNKHAQN